MEIGFGNYGLDSFPKTGARNFCKSLKVNYFPKWNGGISHFGNWNCPDPRRAE